MITRRLPIGAEILPGESGVHFRVWAPRSRAAAVELGATNGIATALAAEAGGYFSGVVARARAGDLYRLRLDTGAFPDPASRFQPEGPHGPSQIVDPAFAWSDAAWRGRPARERVIYELHLGTFTAEGTWRAAMAELAELARLGITVLEVMPVAEFAGSFGWGYDGVDLFAPSRLYGTPDDARTFVNRAHELGLMVLLDVVYNHLGPDGNYLWEFSRDYFSTKHRSEWGETLNFDDVGSAAVREFFGANARYWIEEFHFDGLRFDAAQQIMDRSPTHVIAEIAAAARAAAGPRELFLLAENEPQETRLVRAPAAGGFGLDALWTDDFHHSARVAATGRREAYVSDYCGRAQEFVSAAKRGFLYQGQWSVWQQRRRGTPASELEAGRFVFYLENHDQVANSLRGLRLHQLTSPARYRALTALLLLLPQTPLLFQGQEFAASAPFLYFSDHKPELQKIVAQGRRDFLRQFPSIAAEGNGEVLADPGAVATFQRSKLNLGEREAHAPTYRLHADLLRLRREDPTLGALAAIDGAVLDRDAFVIRFFSTDGEDDRLLLVNLGADLRFGPAPEPLLAPPEGRGWRVAWSSEAPDYGGSGLPPVETTAGWLVPGPAAVWLQPDENHQPSRARLSEKD